LSRSENGRDAKTIDLGQQKKLIKQIWEKPGHATQPKKQSWQYQKENQLHQFIPILLGCYYVLPLHDLTQNAAC